VLCLSLPDGATGRLALGGIMHNVHVAKNPVKVLDWSSFPVSVQRSSIEENVCFRPFPTACASFGRPDVR
jgi:hypothetical protein